MLAVLSFRSLTAPPNTANNLKSWEKFMVQMAAGRNLLVKNVYRLQKTLVAYIAEFYNMAVR
ncbi:hypothetical protein ABIB50_001759 [Mucilaginibacter sp. UYCu711]